MRINSVKRRISLLEATSKLKGPLRELRRGRFVVAIEFFVPYRCFDVTLRNGRDSDTFLLAVDSVCGRLDPWRIDQLTLSEERSAVDTGYVADDRLSEMHALGVVEELTKRATYLKGFFKVRDINIRARYLETLYMPYWVAIYERNNNARLDAINGLTGMHEGAKFREIVADWFQPQ